MAEPPVGSHCGRNAPATLQKPLLGLVDLVPELVQNLRAQKKKLRLLADTWSAFCQSALTRHRRELLASSSPQDWENCQQVWEGSADGGRHESCSAP